MYSKTSCPTLITLPAVILKYHIISLCPMTPIWKAPLPHIISACDSCKFCLHWPLLLWKRYFLSIDKGFYEDEIFQDFLLWTVFFNVTDFFLRKSLLPFSISYNVTFQIETIFFIYFYKFETLYNKINKYSKVEKTTKRKITERNNFYIMEKRPSK